MATGTTQMQTWLSRQGWRANPFTFSVQPGLFVGYGQQAEAALAAIGSGQKLVLLLGPTGSGKTTFLKWLSKAVEDRDIVYLAKPPASAQELLGLFNARYGSRFLFRRKEARTLFELPDFINASTRRPLLLLVDEAHEAPQDVLEWLRVLSDQVQSMTLVLSGLPVFEQILSQQLETLRRRVTARIELLSLTKEATTELVSKRVASAGGSQTFSQPTLDHIWSQSAGFPREVLRTCSAVVERAASLGMDVAVISPENLAAGASVAEPSVPRPETLPSKQKQILEMLLQPMTPAQVVDAMPPEEYPGRGHAIRAVNNILKRLHEDGLVEREQREKTFVYSLSPKMRTLFVQK